MKRLIRIARTELLEHRRQPWMIATMVATFALWCVLFALGFVIVDAVARSPMTAASMQQQLASLGIEPSFVFNGLASSFATLAFTNMALLVAINCGVSMVHDRDCGTMPFFLLAGISRSQLLLGKLLGAMAIPFLLHVVLVTPVALLATTLDTFAPHAAKVGGTPGWWIAFLLGTPASAMLMGAVSAVASGMSRDNRTSMQFTSLQLTILSGLFGGLLVGSISKGLALQLAFAIGSIVGAIAILAIGAKLISTDATP